MNIADLLLRRRHPQQLLQQTDHGQYLDLARLTANTIWKTSRTLTPSQSLPVLAVEPMITLMMMIMMMVMTRSVSN